MITLDGVTITYGSGPRAVVAVRGLTLSVPEGEAVGLVGASTLIGASAVESARAYMANDTINVGCIGTGGRCQHLMKSLAQIPGAKIVAVCVFAMLHELDAVAEERAAVHARDEPLHNLASAQIEARDTRNRLRMQETSGIVLFTRHNDAILEGNR